MHPERENLMNNEGRNTRNETNNQISGNSQRRQEQGVLPTPVLNSVRAQYPSSDSDSDSSSQTSTSNSDSSRQTSASDSDPSERTVNIEGLPINEVETAFRFLDIEMERLNTGNITISRRQNLRRVQTPESSDNSDTPRNSENRGRNLQRTYNFRRNFQRRNNQRRINDRRSNLSRISNIVRHRRSVFYTRRSSSLNSVGDGSYSDGEK